MLLEMLKILMVQLMEVKNNVCHYENRNAGEFVDVKKLLEK